MTDQQYLQDMVSVVIPAHNSATTIERAVVSVVQDGWKNKEIVIVDDGSIDQTPNVLAALQEKYPEIIQTAHQENQGANTARNHGLRIAKGAYVQFLDADDRLENHKLKVSMNAFQANEKLCCVSTNGTQIIGETPKGTLQPSWDHIQAIANRTPETFTTALNTNCPIWNRKFLIENNLFWDERLKCWQESEYYLRILATIGSAKKNLAPSKVSLRSN